MKLTILNDLPERFDQLEAYQLHQILNGPTLLDLNYGHELPPLLISTLLHGNETTGFRVLKKLFQQEYIQNSQRRILIFIGNPQAAKDQQRQLDKHVDMNRIWDLSSPTEESELARDFMTHIKDIPLFACLDLHNTTGKNPHYGCVNVLQEDSLKLAQVFSSNCVYFTDPAAALSVQLSKNHLALTIECGLNDDSDGFAACETLVKSLLKLKNLSELNELEDNFKVYQCIARIFIPKGIDFSVKGDTPESSLVLNKDIDQYNFQTLKAGTTIGRSATHLPQVRNAEGVDLTREYFELIDGQIMVKKSFVPSLISTNKKIIESDCLGYIMQQVKR